MNTTPFEALRDKRMSEMTPEQQNDAKELWIRDQIGWFNEDTRRHLQLLLDRLDVARKAAADTERLDWLLANNQMRVQGSAQRGYVVWDCSNGLEMAGSGKTYREAIDMARGAKESS